MIDSLVPIEAMDFDILVPGHGRIGKKADVGTFGKYMTELHGAVVAAHRAGKSLAEMQQSITMEAYKDWFVYKDYLKLNIEGIYNHVCLQRRGN